jgi:hypothetical protein
MGAIYKNGIPYSGTYESYNALKDKPSINNVSLGGNKSTSDFDLVDDDTLEINGNEKIAIKAIPYTYENDTLTLFGINKTSQGG